MQTHQLPLFPWEQEESTILRAFLVGGMERLGSATLEDAPGAIRGNAPYAYARGVQPLSSRSSDESSLKMNHVEHIPQTLASHSGSYLWEAQQDEHGADMLKSDPRDTFFLSKWLGLDPRTSPWGFGGGKRQDLAVTGTQSIPPTFCLSLGWRASLLGSVGREVGMVWATDYKVGWAMGVVGHGLGLSRSCFSSAPAIEASRVENVLVPCAYSPTYVVKDFPIARYQGLQFVSVSLQRGWGHAPMGDMAKQSALPPPQGRDVSTWLKSRRKCPSLEDQAELPHLDPKGFGLKALGGV